MHPKAIKTGPNNPHSVSLARDTTGLLHIEATDQTGALWGMGFAHAMDRGLQMLQMRIIGQGRVCEQLVDDEASLEVDTFFRRANWVASNNDAADLSSEDAALVQAYCDGANAAFDRKRPWELALLGAKHELWTIADCILITRMMGYVTLAQSQAEVERLFVEMVQAGVSDEKLSAIFPVETPLPNRALMEQVQLGERIVPDAVKWLGAMPRLMSSNNWVVSGAKTKSGAAMMANDPHLEINRLPNVWQELSVQWGATYLIGMTIPGQIGVSIGRNHSVAWGATYTFLDAVDSWIEECRDGQYRREDDWQDFEIRTELVKRKKNADAELTFYQNQHGVLDGDPNIKGHYLATRWASAECGAASLKAALDMMRATTTNQALECLKNIEVSFNWVAADSSGDIGFQMSGLAPKRADDWNGFAPAPGWDPKYDWHGFKDKSDLPVSINPPEGYIVTANQDLNHLGTGDPINMPMGDYRARRIENILQADDHHDASSFGATHMDLYSLQAKRYMEILRALLPDTEDGQALAQWDLCYDPASCGAVLFEAFYAALSKLVFGGGGLGQDVVDHLWGETGIFIDFYAQFDDALLSPDSPWYTDKSQEETFREAFDNAVTGDASGTWGEANSIALRNILFGGKLPAAFGFDVEGVPLPGGRATPHQGQKYSSAGRETTFAPGVRLIADLADDLLLTALIGGPSDRRFSPWYKSGISGWQNGEYEVRHIITQKAKSES